jgi:hypothetical protein
MAVDGAEPRQRRRMAVEHRDDPAIGRHVREQFLDMQAGVNEAALLGGLKINRVLFVDHGASAAQLEQGAVVWRDHQAGLGAESTREVGRAEIRALDHQGPGRRRAVPRLPMREQRPRRRRVRGSAQKLERGPGRRDYLQEVRGGTSSRTPRPRLPAGSVVDGCPPEHDERGRALAVMEHVTNEVMKKIPAGRGRRLSARGHSDPRGQAAMRAERATRLNAAAALRATSVRR